MDAIPIYVHKATGLCVCALLCSAHINAPVTEHVLPVLLTFIQCDSRVLKLLQNARQIHHRDYNLRHSTEVFQQYAICGLEKSCVVSNMFSQTQDNKCI